MFEKLMNKIYFVFISIIIIAIILHERQSAKNEVIVKEQKQQNEIIKDKKIISQRQAVARAVSTNDNLVWLRQHRCKDCESR